MWRRLLVVVLGNIGCTRTCTEIGVYVDADRDGYGDNDRVGYGCQEQIPVVDPGFSFVGGDCADDDAGVSPAADEVCDGLDNDCDGAIDEDAIDAEVFYADADGDGYGDASAPVAACEAPRGAISVGGDCDDTDGSIHPGVRDGAGGVDLDCSGTIEDGVAVLGLGEERFGIAMTIGDFDGDGQEDLAAGAYLSDAPSGGVDNGAAYIIYGPLHGGEADAAGAQTAILYGESQSQAGLGISHPGADLDGDGFPELAIGAPNRSTAQGGSEAGVVTVVSSGQRVASGTLEDAGLTIESDGFIGHFGRGLSFVGDLTEDGVADLFVGAPDYRTGSNTPMGVGFLVSGDALDLSAETQALSEVAVSLWGEAADTEVGFQGAVGLDADGDGQGDLLTSAYKWDGAHTAGRAYLVTGPITASQELAAHRMLSGPDSSARLGFGLGGADLDGDGYDDALLGSIGSSAAEADAGTLWVVPGSASLGAWSADAVDDAYCAALVGAEREAGFGSAVEATDLNDDGVIDLLVGARSWGRDIDGGAAFVFLGPISGTLDSDDAAQGWIRSGVNALAGEVVATGSDLLGTHGPVIAVSANTDSVDGGTSGVGAIFLIDLGP